MTLVRQDGFLPPRFLYKETPSEVPEPGNEPDGPTPEDQLGTSAFNISSS